MRQQDALESERERAAGRTGVAAPDGEKSSDETCAGGARQDEDEVADDGDAACDGNAGAALVDAVREEAEEEDGEEGECVNRHGEELRPPRGVTELLNDRWEEEGERVCTDSVRTGSARV